MKKSLLFFCTFCLTAQLVFAQSTLVINPNPVTVQDVTAETLDGVAHSKVTNEASSAGVFQWERTIVHMTEGWESAVCDKNACYTSAISTRQFEMDAAEEGTMDVHVYPNGYEGQATIEVKVFDTVNPENKVVGIYYFNTSPSGTVEVEKVKLRVYPNPSEGLFTVSTNSIADQVVIYNVAGRPVREFTHNNNKWYDITDLPRGTYFVRILDATKQTLVTRLIQKI
ncbi:MAG: hypothetical protein DHS20C18_01700 [Saprospiraceae bacterium]|nr:MAG: hypothetical protein DHS20C18_01700 [Saprospiraceae bacterium]